MNKFVKFLSALLVVASLSFFAECAYISQQTPNVFYTTDEAQLTLSGALPLSVKCQPQTSFSVPHDFTAKTVTSAGKLTLLDIFPIKTVKIHKTKERCVAPCGTPFGIKLFADGPMVINVSTVDTELGPQSPAADVGILEGDTILTIDGIPIKTNEDLARVVELSQGKNLNICVLRESKKINFSVTPVKSTEDGKYKLGIWVRDSSGGIGTMTFYDPSSGDFCGLGHGVCDIDTGKIIPLSYGDIVEAIIKSINRGEKGKPGELKGAFVDSQPMGKLCSNTETGIYGTLNRAPSEFPIVKVAMKHQVKPGRAKILTTLSGKSPECFDINIENINYSPNNPTKNILICVTDPKLLEKSGGIVQGMSGSPIIQNGMLVGAITHVFVKQPSKGYAIFAETMLSNLSSEFDGAGD